MGSCILQSSPRDPLGGLSQMVGSESCELPGYIGSCWSCDTLSSGHWVVECAGRACEVCAGGHEGGLGGGSQTVLGWPTTGAFSHGAVSVCCYYYHHYYLVFKMSVFRSFRPVIKNL